MFPPFRRPRGEASASPSLNLGHLVHLHEVVFYSAVSALLGGDGALPGKRFIGEGGKHAAQERSGRGQPRARLVERLVKIEPPVDFDLHRVQAARWQAVRVKDMPAGIGRVQRVGDSGGGRLYLDPRDEAGGGAAPEPITKHDLRGLPRRAKWRHRVKIDEHRAAEPRPRRSQRSSDGRVIGPVIAHDPRGDIFCAQPPAPDLVHRPDASRHQAKAAAQFERWRALMLGVGAVVEQRVTLLLAAVEVNPRARNTLDHHRLVPMRGARERIYVPVFQRAQRSHRRADRTDHRGGIVTPAMRH